MMALYDSALFERVQTEITLSKVGKLLSIPQNLYLILLCD